MDLAWPERIKNIPIQKKRAEFKYCGVFQGKEHVGTEHRKPKDCILKETILAGMKINMYLFTCPLMPSQWFQIHCSFELKNPPKCFKTLFINNNWFKCQERVN